MHTPTWGHQSQSSATEPAKRARLALEAADERQAPELERIRGGGRGQNRCTRSCLKNDVSFASAPRCPPPPTPSSPLAALRAVADRIDHQGTPRRQLVTAHSGRPREAEGNEGGRDASANRRARSFEDEKEGRREQKKKGIVRREARGGGREKEVREAI